MTKFKPGDRVRQRGTSLRGTCVESLSSCPRVRFDGTKIEHDVHPELLKLLKPKKRGEWWLVFSRDEYSNQFHSIHTARPRVSEREFCVIHVKECNAQKATD